MTTAKWNTQIELPADPQTALEVATKQYVDAGLATKAPLNSATLTGVPTAPTAALATNTNQLATTAFVQQEIAGLSAGSETGSSILTKLAPVDGTGSGLDADLLDGQEGSYYQNAANLTGTLSDDRLPSSMANKSLTGTVNLASVVVRNWSTGDADIDGLVPGSTFGALIEGPSSGHLVIGLRSNDSNEGFYILDKGDAVDPLTAVYANTLLAVSRAQFNYLENTIWHAGNDGAGSTLDADLLDGQEGSYYRNAANLTGTIADARLPASMSGKTFTDTTTIDVGGGVASSTASLSFKNGSHVGNFFGWLNAGSYNPLVQAGDHALIFHDGSSGTGGFFIGPWHASGYGLRLDATGAATINGNDIWHGGNLDPASTVINYARQTLNLPSAGSASANDVYVRGLAQYKNDTAAPVGAIVFSAPDGRGSTMHNLLIHGTNYVGGETFATQVAGYRATASSGWTQTSKVNFGKNDVLVRFAVDANGKNCIILGDVATSWSYPHIVLDGYFGHSGANEAYGQGWTAALVTDLSAYTYVSSTIGDSGLASYANPVFTQSAAVNALAGTNANWWLRDDAGINKGVWFWDRASGQVILRKYKADSSAWYDFAMDDTNVSWQGNNIWHAGNFTATTIPTQTASLGFTSGNGRGIKFWDSTLYSIYMSSAPDATYGGRVSGETTSDYNMYFKMSGGTNRGFVFVNGTTPVAGIDGAGNCRINGGFEGNTLNVGRIVVGYDSGIANSINCSGWFRTTGTAGLYCSSYGSGIHMTDTTYVKTYNNGNKAMMASDFVISSDEKLKTAISDLMFRGRLRPVNFTWKADGKPDMGFIAQEVEKLYPEVVGRTRDDDGSERMILSYPRLTAVLSHQVNRAEDEIVELKNKNAALAAEVEDLKAKLAQVMASLGLS